MVLSKVLSFGEGKELRRSQALVPEINAFEPAMQQRSDAEAYAANARAEADTYASKTRAEADAYAASTRQGAERDAAATAKAGQDEAKRIVDDANRRRRDIETVISDLEARRDAVVSELERLASEVAGTATLHRPATVETSTTTPAGVEG